VKQTDALCYQGRDMTPTICRHIRRQSPNSATNCRRFRRDRRRIRPL